MKVNFFQYILIREPFSNPDQYLNSEQHFLNDQNFRACLLIATPSFYAKVERSGFDVSQLSSKELLTLQKYINRYCFRPTPFGLFASVCLADWNQKTTANTDPAYSTFVHADMAALQSLPAYSVKDQATFEANPSIYRISNEFRFLIITMDESAMHREYQLQSITYTVLLKALVKFCKKARPLEDIVSLTSDISGCTREEAIEYIEFLIHAQFLLAVGRLNITGEDYTEQLNKKPITDLVNKIVIRGLAYVTKEPSTDLPSPTDLLRKKSVLKAITSGSQQAQLNVILKRSGTADVPGPQIYDKLKQAIAALQLISGKESLPAMTQFSKDFRNHFEGRMIPLLTAIDPEAGIGYQMPEREKNNPLLETLNIQPKSLADHTVNWSALHTLLLEVWLNNKSPVPIINLTTADLKKIKPQETAKPLTGTSVLFRLVGDQILIENAGGNNAPALLGRFTVTDQRIKLAAQQMARNLEEQNPQVIFAELLHLTDPHIDNVNRRAHIYSYELPITAPSTLPPSRQIELSDLYVTIEDNKVLLFSKKHQKIVIPRHTSAYNHNLNKLPLFRFLADLPYQYSRYNLSFDLRPHFPGLSFYPRVQFEETIVSLATWVLTAAQLASLQAPDDQLKLLNFYHIKEEIKLPPFFTLSEGDQELVFDHAREKDILFFCRCIVHKNEVVLKEHLYQKTIRQYNAFLMPAEKLILPQPALPFKEKPKEQRMFIPGSDWLYLKFYSPKIRANSLLLRLRPLFTKRYGKYQIKQWFFIRYQDPAPHIRLRLMVAPEAISEVLLAFKTKLAASIDQHVIREYQINIYTRELERYAAVGIEVTENFFCTSSELVMQFLFQNKKEWVVSNHLFALFTLKVIISVFIENMEDQISFTLSSYEQFMPEFSGDTIKVGLDKKYRELASEIDNGFKLEDPALLSGSRAAGLAFINSLETIRQNLNGTVLEVRQYLRSIIHMHLNRIFIDDSRKQEMACYYLLYKKLVSDRGKNKYRRNTDKLQ
jgi:thiopeptide-type bacteriocin biosynthesis protein